MAHSLRKGLQTLRNMHLYIDFQKQSERSAFRVLAKHLETIVVDGVHFVVYLLSFFLHQSPKEKFSLGKSFPRS